MNENTTVEDRIHLISKKHGLSETKIAIQSGVSVSALTQACRTNKITFKLAHKVANTFNINAEWLISGVGEPYINEFNTNENNTNQNENTMQTTTVKQRIDFICSQYGISETHIANTAKIAQSSISYASKNNKISYNLASKISTSFGLNIDWLILGRGQPFKNDIEKTSENILDKEHKDIANPKNIKMYLSLTKHDRNSISDVTVDEGSGFIGNALYVINVLDSPQLYFIKADALGNITLITPEHEQNITKEEFESLNIVGVVKGISKKFN